MPKIYIAVDEKYPWFRFSGERDWKSDREAEVTEEELDFLRRADEVIDKRHKFLDEKYG